jgi:hypothetical protein
MRTLQASLAIILAGLAFFYVDTFLVGFAAALSFPTWYAEFVAKNSGLGFVIWDLVTVVPVTVVSAILVGIVLGRVLVSSYFLSGLAAMAVAIAFATVTAETDLPMLATLRNTIFPVYWFQAPSYLALWLSLPLATQFFGNRSNPVPDDMTNVPV